MNPPPPMPQRILMTADAVGGVWTYALDLARSLGAHGVEVVLAVMGPPPSPAQRDAAARLENVSLHHAPFALEWMDDPWTEVDRAGGWLLDLADRFRPELIHLNGYAHAALPWEAPVVIVAHSCVLSWWSAVKGTPAPMAYDPYRRRVAAGLAAADLVVAPTGAMLAALAREYGPVRAGRVVPNAADPQRFAPGRKRRKIFAAGRAWDEAKNLATLDAAALGVRWPVFLAGECAHPGGGSVRFEHTICLGKLEPVSVRAHLSESLIYALPARYEPFGLSALEAGLSGCALMLGDIPSLREVWDEDAEFVAPDDVHGLAHALNALIDDAPRRRALGLRARTRARQFSQARTTDGYLDAYRACARPVSMEVAA